MPFWGGWADILQFDRSDARFTISSLLASGYWKPDDILRT